MHKCPYCGGNKYVETSSHVLVPCPMCDATGVDPGQEDFFVYVFDQTLPASVPVSNLKTVIDGTAGFRWKALTGTQEDVYRVRFRQGSGQYMSTGGIGASNDLVNNENMVGTAQFPFPIGPPHPYFAPSSQILMDFQDLSGAENVIQLAFIGAKVVPTPQ